VRIEGAIAELADVDLVDVWTAILREELRQRLADRDGAAVGPTGNPCDDSAEQRRQRDNHHDLLSGAASE
jgi:hypothetical protein